MPMNRASFMHLPPDPLSHVYDSLSGGDLARLRAVSKAHRNQIDGDDGSKRKIRDEDPDRRRALEYQEALDVAFDFLQADKDIHDRADYLGRSMTVVFTDGTFLRIHADGSTLRLTRPRQAPTLLTARVVRRIRSAKADSVMVVEIERLGGYHHPTLTLYPKLRVSADYDESEFYYFSPSNLTRSGGIAELFTRARNRNSVPHHRHPNVLRVPS